MSIITAFKALLDMMSNITVHGRSGVVFKQSYRTVGLGTDTFGDGLYIFGV